MPDISRRAVLGGAAGAAAFVAVGADPADAATVPAPVRAHYATSVGKTFVAVSGKRKYTITLSAIRDAVPARAKDKPYVFTLILTPTRGTHLPEGIYSLTRRGVPTHSLLLTAVGSTGRMQAAINRAPR